MHALGVETKNACFLYNYESVRDRRTKIWNARYPARTGIRLRFAGPSGTWPITAAIIMRISPTSKNACARKRPVIGYV